MESLRELFRIGKGPSSSHTMGPQKAAEIFSDKNPKAASFEVTLYGSLAATGKGHMTDVAIEEILKKHAPLEIVWEPATFLPFHPNGMRFKAFNEDKKIIDDWTVYSVGGGALSEGKKQTNKLKTPHIYKLKTLTDIMHWCEDNGKGYWEYVDECEDDGIWEFLGGIWETMKKAVERGLDHEGALPGPLNLARKAPSYYSKACRQMEPNRSKALIFSYALAVSEENAGGGIIATAPTCGACGTLPGIMYHLYKQHNFSDEKMIHAIATAGIFGNIAKHNASISGAEVGCQGEVGVACAMASAAACQLYGGSPAQIEYAAEMGLEHHLGLTCDPVCGLVQIPCIERNAFAATRAMDSNLYAILSDGNHNVSYDRVVTVMKMTGHDLPSLYKETSLGGLAKVYKKQNKLRKKISKKDL